jgi:hypothetical protein
MRVMILALLQESVSTGNVTMSGSDLEGVIGVVMILTMVVHIWFAIFVRADAMEIDAEESRRVFGSPSLWLLATLVGGLFTATIYWVMHRSPLGHDAPLNRV